MRPLAAVVVLLASTWHEGSQRSFKDGALAMTVDGASLGFVRSAEGGDAAGAPLVVKLQDATPALADMLAAARPKSDVTLSTAALARRAKAAKLTSVRAPAIGYGAPDKVRLAFTLDAPLAGRPLLTPASDAQVARGDAITGFRVDVAGKPAPAAKIQDLELVRREGGGYTPSPLELEVQANEVAPWTAWAKAQTPRALRLDYVGDDDAARLRFDLDGCRLLPPRPTNGPTSRVTVTCASAKASR